MSNPRDPEPTRSLPRADATRGEGETVAAPLADRTALHRGAGREAGDLGAPPRSRRERRAGGEHRHRWFLAAAVLVIGFFIGGGIAFLSDSTGGRATATPRTTGPEVVVSASTAATTTPTIPAAVTEPTTTVSQIDCAPDDGEATPGQHGFDLRTLGHRFDERRGHGRHDASDPACATSPVTISGG